MARGFSQSRSEIAGYGVSNKNPFGLEPKAVRRRFDGSIIKSKVEENPKRLFDPSEGIGGGAYEANKRLKAELEAEGITGIAGPLTRRNSIMPESVPTYTPDELLEAERIQKGEIRIFEGPGAAERRRQRIEATKAANRARLQGDFGDLTGLNYSRTGSKPKKLK